MEISFIDKFNQFCDKLKSEEKPTFITEQEDEEGSGINSSHNTNSEDNNFNLYNIFDNFEDHFGQELQTEARHKKKKIEKIKVTAIDITTLTE